MPLDFASYRRNESLGRGRLSARAVQVATPVTFQHLGYPDRVGSDDEIAWYVDAMHEVSGEPNTYISDDFLVSEDERALIEEVREIVAGLTRAQFGREIRPWTSPLLALHSFRLICQIEAIVGRRVSVYELGPGSGYLGAFLIRTGHRYMSSDVAEGFYLWQSRLQEACAPGEFAEMAASDGGGAPSDPGAQVVHVPWWIHGNFYQAPCPFSADIVMCEHALGEMSSIGLRYNIRAARDILSKAPEPLFVTSDVGMPNVTRVEGIIKNLYEGGFVPLVVTGPLAFVPSNSKISQMGIAPDDLTAEIRSPGSRRQLDHPLLHIGSKISPYAPSGGLKLLSAKHAFSYDLRTAPADFPFVDYINDGIY
jgi:hypothetical protein